MEKYSSMYHLLWMYLAGTIGLFHWKERKVGQLQQRYQQEHGPPRGLQHDQEREFDGAVNKLCKKLGIKVIKGLPYHPQSQGKIERAHRSLKKKITYDYVQSFNYAKNRSELGKMFARICKNPSSETQGQLVGTGKSLKWAKKKSLPEFFFARFRLFPGNQGTTRGKEKIF